MNDTKNCPYCGEEILIAAKKCKHCREWLKNEDTTTAKEASNSKKNETQETIEASDSQESEVVVKKSKAKLIAMLIVSIAIVVFVLVFIFRSFSEAPETGVVIDGVRWATRNVDAPGTFADSPESSGMFFQWNRRKGWNATNKYVEGWDSFNPLGTAWYAENDPCPEGWRVPNADELRSLHNTGHIWIANWNNTGVSGRLFGTAPNQIFLPATGSRYFGDGRLEQIGEFGAYWSDALNVDGGAQNLAIIIDNAGVIWFPRAGGLSVRCVAGVNDNRPTQKQPPTQSFSAPIDGVIINGVRWATRNVDAPGTFAASPVESGMFFQWNRQKGWAATGNVTGWDNSEPTGTTWTRANDPCPQGWRVPTEAEFRSLVSAGSSWATLDGVDGRMFSSAPNRIFLPAAGWRSWYDGSRQGIDGYISGRYWSSTLHSGIDADPMDLTVSINSAGLSWSMREVGFSIRCVSKN